jgi:hypothetical protein
MGQKPENQQSSEIKTANESLEAPKFEDTPIEDKKPVEENENNTEINEADPLENTVLAEARYRVDQILKKTGKKKVWEGDIRWILIGENGALKILSLDFKHQKPR